MCHWVLCSELETQIIVGANQNYFPKEVKEELLEQLDHESRMLMNMIKSLDSSLRLTINDKRIM